MAGQRNISWRQLDTERLRDLTRRFNAKVARVNKKGSTVAQPAKVNAKALEATLKKLPRNVYNREIRKMEQYLQRGAEKEVITKAGVHTTKWQRDEAHKAARAIGARNAARRKKEFSVRSTEYGTMTSEAINNLKPRKDRTETARTAKELQQYFENLDREINQGFDATRNARYKENFLYVVARVIGIESELYKEIAATPASELYQYQLTDPLLALTAQSPVVISTKQQETMILNHLRRAKGKPSP